MKFLYKDIKSSKEFHIMYGILLFGLIIRAVYLCEITKLPDFSNPELDAGFHDYWARDMVTGYWPIPENHSDPLIDSTPYQKSPGYPYFLSIVYLIFGPSYLAVRIVQMGIGLLNCVLAFFFGRKWFGSSVGLTFSAFMSFYWIFIYFEGELYAPIIIVFLTLLLISALSNWCKKTGFLQYTVTGCILGLFAIVRANILLFWPIAIVWSIWIAFRKKDFRHLPMAIAGFIMGAVLIIAPVTIRNYMAANDLVLISSNGGLNLFIGNNELSDGIKPIIPNLKELTGLDSWSPFEYPLIVRGLEKKLGRPLTHSQASSYWVGEAVKYIKTHIWKTLALIARKSILFWSNMEIANPSELHYARMHSWLLRNIPANFSIILSLSIVGFALMFHDTKTGYRYEGYNNMQYEVSVIILLFILTYFVSFLPFLVSARFRVPIIPFLLLFGSYGLCRAANFYIKKRNFREVIYFLIACIILYITVSANWMEYKHDPAKWHYDLGLAYEKNGQAEQAIKEYLEVLKINPGYARADNNIGLILTKQGKLEEAIEHLSRALQIMPGFVEAHNNMGSVLFKQGNLKEAIEYFSEALRINPEFAKAHNNLGLALSRQGRLEDAVRHIAKALQIMPRFAKAHNNLGITLFKQGKLEEAAEHFYEALNLNPGFAKAHNNIGSTLFKLGRIEEAIQHFSRALQIEPNYTTAQNNMKGALAERKKRQEK